MLRNEKLRNEAGFSVYSTFESFEEDTIASNGVSSENFLHYVLVIPRRWRGGKKRSLQTRREISEIELR